MSSFSSHFTKEDLPFLTGSPESYNLTPKSSFIDIGSGFGKPVFHTAMFMGKPALPQDVEVEGLK